jgi:hypothetical protein
MPIREAEGPYAQVDHPGRLLAAAAFALASGAGVMAAQPKKDIGYDPRAHASEQLDPAVAMAATQGKRVLLMAFIERWRSRAVAR